MRCKVKDDAFIIKDPLTNGADIGKIVHIVMAGEDAGVWRVISRSGPLTIPQLWGPNTTSMTAEIPDDWLLPLPKEGITDEAERDTAKPLEKELTCDKL